MNISENCEICLNGPLFLLNEVATRVTDEITNIHLCGNNADTAPDVCMVTTQDLSFGIGKVIDVTRFSSLSHVLCALFHKKLQKYEE